MRDQRDWMHNCNILINEICAAWDIPSLPCLGGRVAYVQPLPRDVETPWPEHEIPHVSDDNWCDDGERFVFITDSQCVKNVLCGHSSLTNEHYRPGLRRLMANILQFVQRGMLPPSDVADPVEWRAREFNKRADWLCNRALDTRSSYKFREDDIHDLTDGNVHWECFSDGACRGKGQSAFSWIIVAIRTLGGQRHRFTLAFGYELVEGNHSSFSTELWGIEAAMQALQDLKT